MVKLELFFRFGISAKFYEIKPSQMRLVGFFCEFNLIKNLRNILKLPFYFGNKHN